MKWQDFYCLSNNKMAMTIQNKWNGQLLHSIWALIHSIFDCDLCPGDFARKFFIWTVCNKAAGIRVLIALPSVKLNVFLRISSCLECCERYNCSQLNISISLFSSDTTFSSVSSPLLVNAYSLSVQVIYMFKYNRRNAYFMFLKLIRKLMPPADISMDCCVRIFEYS